MSRHGRGEARPPKGRHRGSVNLARALSKLGYCSRSEAVRLILAGRVRLDGLVVRDPSRRCVPEEASIVVGGTPVRSPAPLYIMMNKPAGVVTTHSDERGRKTVYDTLGETGRWVFPVGRLDKDTSGLLLFTNDTRFGDSIADPSRGIEKRYRATLDAVLENADKLALEKGMSIGGERYLPARVGKSRGCEVEIFITEGKNRQIRRMFEALGYRVMKLERLGIGPLALGTLKPGEWRTLQPEEIETLRKRKGQA